MFAIDCGLTVSKSARVPKFVDDAEVCVLDPCMFRKSRTIVHTIARAEKSRLWNLASESLYEVCYENYLFYVCSENYLFYVCSETIYFMCVPKTQKAGSYDVCCLGVREFVPYG